MAGTRSTDLPLASSVDEFLGNSTTSGGSQTVRATADSIAAQLGPTITSGVQSQVTTLSTTVSGNSSNIATMQGQIASLQAVSGTTGLGYATLSALNADLARPANTLAIVFNDPTAANNGNYIKVGASGSGSWSYQGPLPATVTQVSAVAPTLRDQSSDVLSNFVAVASNGATITYDASGFNPTGLSIGSAVTGAVSYLIYYLPFTTADFARLAGETIQIVTKWTVTSGFLAAKPLTTQSVQINRSSNVGTQVSVSQSGTVLTVIDTYTVAGTETGIGKIFQISSSATSGATHTAALSSYSLSVIAESSSVGPGGATLDFALRKYAAQPFGGGSLYNDLAPTTGGLYNTVSWINDSKSGNIIGWSIPAGTLGGATNVYFTYNLAPEELPLYQNRTVRVKLSLNTSSNYARAITPKIFTKAAGGSAVAASNLVVTKNAQVSATRRVIVMHADIPASAIVIMANIQNTSDTTTATTDTVALADFELEILSTPSDWLNNTDEVVRAITAKATRTARKTSVGSNSRVYGGKITLAASGGDYTTMASAVAALMPNQEIYVSPGTYTEAEWYPTSSEVSIRGAGSGLSAFALAQANSATLANITAYSMASIRFGGNYSGFKATTTNGRYVIHDDSANSFKGAKKVFEDLYLEHLGNAGAYNYQVSLGGSGNPSGVWGYGAGATAAYGMGASDGSETQFHRCTLIGYNAPGFYGHDWPSFSFSVRLFFKKTSFVANAVSNTTTPCFKWELHGSRQFTTVQFEGCQFSGPIEFGPAFWSNGDAADQVANKMELTVCGDRCGVPIIVSDDGSRALRIDSATTGALSSVAVSGTGATAIFGGTVIISGAAGLSGAVYGLLDIGEHGVGPSASLNITSLGYRLGDCSSVNKTMSVTVDGGSPITVTFNQNYTSVANSTIISAIQTALGSAATVSQFNVNDLWRPRFADEEVVLTNTDTTTIKRKTVVKYDATTQRGGKVMTSADAATSLAGIALEDILPGASGRVKIAGALRVAQDILRSDAGSFVAGATFGVGSTAGRLSASASTPLFGAINSADVKFLTSTRSVVA